MILKKWKRGKKKLENALVSLEARNKKLQRSLKYERTTKLDHIFPIMSKEHFDDFDTQLNTKTELNSFVSIPNIHDLRFTHFLSIQN